MLPGQLQTAFRGKLPPLPPDLDEGQPQGVESHPPRSARYQPSPQGVQQPLSCGGQQQPEPPVGDEPVTAEAVGLEVELEALDPVLALPAPDLGLVELFGLVGPRGYQEAGVGAPLRRLGLVDDSALLLPASEIGRASCRERV